MFFLYGFAMTKSEILLITGATSGLGLRTVQHLAKTSHFEFIIGARQPDQAQVLQAVVPQERLTVLPLDLASLKSVKSFAAAVIEYLGHRQLNAVAFNAGIQITTGLEQSVDGVEKTFASNYLGHFYLMQELMPSLSDGAIAVLTASGTHDPRIESPDTSGFGAAFFQMCMPSQTAFWILP